MWPVRAAAGPRGPRRQGLMAFPPQRGFPMLTQGSRLRLILRLGLSLVMGWSMTGWDGASSANGTAAPISPR